MTIPKKTTDQLENFDDLFADSPETMEQNLTDLLPQAKTLEDKSIYLQILSQIAFSQSVQKKFELAHQTLDNAEAQLAPKYALAKVRILHERGRVFSHQSNNNAALPFLVESYDLSTKYGFDEHALKAAHLASLIVKNINEKITWTKRTIDLAEKKSEKKISGWFAALHKKLGELYIESENYKAALSEHTKSRPYAEETGDPILVLAVNWGIGRSLRSLGQLDAALKIQMNLLKKNTELPPQEALIGRGLIYEELAEIHSAQKNYEECQKYASLAYQDLSQDPSAQKLLSVRLEKMLNLSRKMPK